MLQCREGDRAALGKRTHLRDQTESILDQIPEQRSRRDGAQSWHHCGRFGRGNDDHRAVAKNEEAARISDLRLFLIPLTLLLRLSRFAQLAMEDQHIVIVGGGIIGVTTAYYLAHSPKFGARTRVTLLEACEVAAGSSGKAGGLLSWDLLGNGHALSELSFDLHEQLANEHGGKERWGYRNVETVSIEADCSRNGGMSNGRTKKDSIDWIDPTVLKRQRILSTDDTTAQVHPGLFTKAIAELAVEAGVEIIHATVDAISLSPLRLIATPLASSVSQQQLVLEPTQILLAAGPWTGGLVEKLFGGTKGGGRARDIDGERAHSVVLRPNEGLSLPAQAWFTSIKLGRGRSCEPEIYCRPDGTAYACGTVDDSPLPRLASDVETDPKACREIIDQVALLSPAYLKTGENPTATIETMQACYLPTGSGAPVLGKIAEGVFVASGHSCWGITLGKCRLAPRVPRVFMSRIAGPGTGYCMAELMLEGRSKIDLSSFAP